MLYISLCTICITMLIHINLRHFQPMRTYFCSLGDHVTPVENAYFKETAVGCSIAGTDGG